MNMIVYLRKYFAEGENEAAIPGLGVFYTEKNQEDQIQILFKEKIPKSKSFVNFVAFEENITEEECLEKINHWKKNIVSDLRETSVASIPELGTFEIKDKIVCFYPSKDQFPQDDKFGLETPEGDEFFEDKGIDGLEVVVPKTEKAKKKRRKKNLLWGGLILLIAIIASVFLVPASREKIFLIFSSNTSQATQIVFPGDSSKEEYPFDEEFSDEELFVENQDVVSEQEVAQAIISSSQEVKYNETTKPKVDAKQESQFSKSESEKATSFNKLAPQKGRYYIIVGAFSNMKNAEKEANKWKLSATKPEILFLEERNIYYVSIHSFSERTQAQDYKPKAQKIIGNASCWVYSK